MTLLQLREKGFFSPNQRRKWLILIAIFGVSGYGVYKVHHLPSLARKRERFMKIFEALISITQSISDSAETVSILSRDLKSFMNSNSNEIPNSLKQMAKITKSNEVTSSVSRVSEAITIGVFHGYNIESSNYVSGSKSEPSIVDKVTEKIFSKSGSGFISVIVGSFAKNLVLGFYSDELENGVDCSSDESRTPKWVNVLCDDKFKELLADCIQRFTCTAVSVYLDKTLDINPYDQIFAGLTNPKHRDDIRDVLVSICNGSVKTLVKTSHQVLTSSIDDSKRDDFKIPNSSRNKIDKGWTETVGSTLAVPSNRRFIFDVTGRVTFETIRSMFGYVMLKILEGFKRSFHVIHEEVIERGRQVIEYVGARSCGVIIVICVAVYLHIMSRYVQSSEVVIRQEFQGPDRLI